MLQKCLTHYALFSLSRDASMELGSDAYLVECTFLVPNMPLTKKTNNRITINENKKTDVAIKWRFNIFLSSGDR